MSAPLAARAAASVEERAFDRALAAAAATREDEGVRAAVGRAILDGLSVALAGQGHPRIAALREELLRHGSGAADVWGHGPVADPQAAALLNGAAIHAYDFDDTHDAAIVHAMSVILPAAFAGADLAGGATRVPAAVAAGTELACNVSLAAGAYAGWHYTTLCGTLGAALACGVAMGLDRARLLECVGNAYVFAAGNKQAVLESSLMKRLMPGFAARNAVLAVQSATAGLGGVGRWLTGEYGLFELFYGGNSRPEQVHGGGAFRVEELSFKPVPACRFTHGAIEATARLREELGAAGRERILAGGEVLVRYPSLERFGIVCRPYQARGAAEMDAQFSTAYLVAMTLRDGAVGFASYEPAALADERIAALAARVEVRRDLTPRGPDDLGPIEVSAGGVTQRVEEVLGSPRRPLGEDAQRAKLADCLAKATGQTIHVDELPFWDELQRAITTLESGGQPGALLKAARDQSKELGATNGR